MIGARASEDADAVAELYSTLGGEVVKTDLRTAEMIKYVANSFLATRVSFINEIARLCEHIGVDIDHVVRGIAADARIGSHFFSARDRLRRQLSAEGRRRAPVRGRDASALRRRSCPRVQAVNQTQRTNAVRRLVARLGPLEGRTIGVWGLTFKGGTEDARESPAMDVVNLILNEGAEVQAYDPGIAEYPAGLPEAFRSIVRSSPIEAARGADALAILTDWNEFRDVSLAEVREAMAGWVIFDGRNMLSRSDAEAAGFAYLGVGRVPRTPNRRRGDS